MSRPSFDVEDELVPVLERWPLVVDEDARLQAYLEPFCRRWDPLLVTAPNSMFIHWFNGDWLSLLEMTGCDSGPLDALGPDFYEDSSVFITNMGTRDLTFGWWGATSWEDEEIKAAASAVGWVCSEVHLIEKHMRVEWSEEQLEEHVRKMLDYSESGGDFMSSNVLCGDFLATPHRSWSCAHNLCVFIQEGSWGGIAPHQNLSMKGLLCWCEMVLNISKRMPTHDGDARQPSCRVRALDEHMRRICRLYFRLRGCETKLPQFGFIHPFDGAANDQ